MVAFPIERRLKQKMRQLLQSVRQIRASKRRQWQAMLRSRERCALLQQLRELLDRVERVQARLAETSPPRLPVVDCKFNRFGGPFR